MFPLIDGGFVMFRTPLVDGERPMARNGYAAFASAVLRPDARRLHHPYQKCQQKFAQGLGGWAIPLHRPHQEHKRAPALRNEKPMSLNRETSLEAPTALPTVLSALSLAAGLALGAVAGLFLHRARLHREVANSISSHVEAQAPAMPFERQPATSESASRPLVHNAGAAVPPHNQKQAMLNWEDLGLTRAESRIALRIVRGYPFSSIAEELGASSQSIRKAASRIYHKAGVATRQDFTAQVASICPADLPIKRAS